MYLYHLCMHMNVHILYSPRVYEYCCICAWVCIMYAFSIPSSAGSCDMQCRNNVSKHSYPPHAVYATTARKHSSINFSNLLSRLCCFIIDYSVDTLVCVNTAGLVCLQWAAPSVRLKDYHTLHGFGVHSVKPHWCLNPLQIKKSWVLFL